jgi:hypothetical protein
VEHQYRSIWLLQIVGNHYREKYNKKLEGDGAEDAYGGWSGWWSQIAFLSKIARSAAMRPNRKIREEMRWDGGTTSLQVTLGLVGQGRGHHHAHALGGTALHDWCRGRGGRRCARDAFTCPARSAPPAHELDPSTTRSLSGKWWGGRGRCIQAPRQPRHQIHLVSLCTLLGFGRCARGREKQHGMVRAAQGRPAREPDGETAGGG